jgi:hypothetical protein
MAAFIPGESPPLVITASVFTMEGLLEKRFATRVWKSRMATLTMGSNQCKVFNMTVLIIVHNFFCFFAGASCAYMKKENFPVNRLDLIPALVYERC